MEQDLLRYLLATFPESPSAPPPESGDDYLVIHGYRVPFESPVDEVMLEILAEFRRTGFRREAAPAIGRG